MRGLKLDILSSGALVDVSVGLSEARRRVMARQGREIPPPVLVKLLIDTGASTSLVDEGVMRTLQLTPTGATAFHSSSSNGVAQNCDMYDVQMFLGGLGKPTSLRIDPIPIMATPFINQPFEGLLGRDVLNRIRLVWNGPGGALHLEYP